MRYALIVIFALILFILYQNYKISSLKKVVDNLEATNINLTETLERAKNAEMEANKRIAALRKSAEASKDNFDWFRARIPDDILVQLRKKPTIH